MTLHRSTCIPAPEFSHRETKEPVPPQGTLERLLLRTEQTGWSVVYKKCRGPTVALTAEKTSECLLLATKRLFSSSGSGGMVQKHLFSGNTRDLSADPDRSRVGAGLRESLAAVLGL